ncbi:hypothetical protein PENSPDRAFT_686856 [Peniophora sp. CONT]|nr:hypothetical protein PENSPDRAFT_686856 [Peniophora sp. CONT]
MPPLTDSLYPSWLPLPSAPDPSPTVLTLESFTLPSFSFSPLSSDSATSTLSSALTSTFVPTPATSTSTQPSPTQSANIDESNAAALFQLRTALYLLIVGCVSLVVIIVLHGYLFYKWRRQRAEETTITSPNLKAIDSTSDLSSFASPGGIFPRAPSDAETVENGSAPSIEPMSARTFDFRCQGGTTGTTTASSFPSSLSILAKPKTTRDRGIQTESKRRRCRELASIETCTSTQPNSPTSPSHTSRDTVGRIVAAYSYHQSNHSSISSPSASSRFHPEYTTTSSSSQTDRDGPTLTLQFPTPPSTGLSVFAPLDARALSRAGRNSPFSDSGEGKRDRRRGREGGSREDNVMLEQFLRSVVLDGEDGRESAIRTISHSSAGVEEGRWWFV